MLAHNIALLNEHGVLRLAVVEFGYLDFKEGFTSFSECSAFSKNWKVWIYWLFLKQLKKLHKFLIPHLSINSEKIWVSGNFKQPKTLKVFLSPFIIDFENPDNVNSDIWYAAPEILFNSPDFHNRIECDLWSIGCVLYELFSG